MQTLKSYKKERSYTYPTFRADWEVDTPRREALIDLISDRQESVAELSNYFYDILYNDLGGQDKYTEEVIDKYDQEQQLLTWLTLEGPSVERFEELDKLYSDSTYEEIKLLASPYLKGTRYETVSIKEATIIYANTDYDWEIDDSGEVSIGDSVTFEPEDSDDDFNI